MQGTYTPWLVYLSIAVAIVVSYTALSLAARMSGKNGHGSVGWVVGGGIVLGVGIWSMHFVGMLALSLPVRLTYSLPITALSLIVAIGICAFALFTVGRETLSLLRLVVGSLVLGLGIAAMHYIGMAGIRIVPGISYDPSLFIASLGIAISASFAALWLAFRLRRGSSWQMNLARYGAATLMGLAISGMHYTGMAASNFAAGSYCLAGAALDNTWFAIVLSLFALGIMAIAILTVVYDAWLQQHQRDRDAAINSHLRNANRADALTGLPNRIALSEAAETALVRAAQRDGQLALLVLDVDRLKSINDSLGHEAGDQMLLELSRRLRSVLRHNDTLARLAGDEFTILATELRSARDAEAVAEKVMEQLQKSFTFAGVD
ncbi:MAG: MHYT domain-containing protein, partial [Povalibacter sp.]